MATTKNDELNVNDGSLTRRAVLDIMTFFGEMDLTDEQKEKRIKMAQEMEMFLAMLLLMLQAEIRLGNDINRDYYYNYTKTRLKQAVEGNLRDNNVSNKMDLIEKSSDMIASSVISPKIDAFLDTQVREIIDSTIKNQNDAYFFSKDRATLIAENEANGVCNCDELEEAVRNGYKYKMWNTMQDRKVRHTHMVADGEKIGIFDAFKIGRCKMLAPMIFDEGSPEDAKEIINCRCTLSFAKKR